MSLRPRWHPAAEQHLKDIGWHPAEFVDAAVQRYAATGRGDVERLVTREYVLRVGPYRVWFIVEGDVMHVLAVYGPRRMR